MLSLTAALVLFVVQVYSQTSPYISFLGKNMTNHSLLDLNQVETPERGQCVQCHTDLSSCCKNSTIIFGDWYFPNGSRLQFTSDIYQVYGTQVIELCRAKDSVVSPSGIYRCDIPTNAVHDDNNTSVRDTVYVGLYATGGSLSLNLDSDLDTFSLQFTLTCTSTGGPATTVTWTEDTPTSIITEEIATVLDDPETAQYSHTLIVTSPGNYTCTVANSISTNTTTIEVQGTSQPTNVTAVSSGFNSITVAWTLSVGATGYRVDYNSSGGPSGGVDVLTSNSTVLTNLQNGNTYTISVVAFSEDNLPSERVEASPVTLEAGIAVAALSVSNTHATLTWRASGKTITYTIFYSNTNTECFNVSGSAVVRSTSYNLTGLQEGTNYSFSVTTILNSGESVRGNVVFTTLAAVPSAAPASVRVSVVASSTTVSVEWGPVDCIHRNGEITGYSVRYREKGSSEDERVTKIVSGNSSGGTVTISELTIGTVYTIEVAAVNRLETGDPGIGVYSDLITFETPIEDVYLSLNGSILPNNSYVVINDIGTTERTSLLCHTDTPPMSGASDSGGDWVSPSGQVAGDTQVPGFEVDRDSMVVRLKRNYSQVPTEGMYHCLIESRAQAQQIIYAGLYLEGGGDIEILGMTFTVDSDLNGASPQFTLSCISTGGPATTVAWTRDSTPVAEGNTTVLDDPVTARYIHNLIVNGRAEGVYSCTVANTKTSVASVSLNAAAAALNATNITSTSQGREGDDKEEDAIIIGVVVGVVAVIAIAVVIIVAAILVLRYRKKHGPPAGSNSIDLSREYNEGPSNDASSMGKSGDGQQTLSVPRDQSPSTSHSSLLSTGESRLV